MQYDGLAVVSGELGQLVGQDDSHFAARRVLAGRAAAGDETAQRGGGAIQVDPARG